MKTHTLAGALRKLADMLEAAPDVELSKQLKLGQQEMFGAESVAVNLQTLMALSRINKSDWVKLIHEYGFEIEVRPRDSSRNILGQILVYLDSHPEAVATLQKRTRIRDKEPSALSQALDVLLKGVSVNEGTKG